MNIVLGRGLEDLLGSLVVRAWCMSTTASSLNREQRLESPGTRGVLSVEYNFLCLLFCPPPNPNNMIAIL
jgi:hypothetical protein